MARLFERLLEEVARRAPSRADADAALDALRARVEGGVVIVGGSGEPFLATVTKADVIRIDDGVYAGIPTRAARIRLLETAKERAKSSVVLRVAVSADRSHLARAVLDTPRRVFRLAGLGLPEPGDRFGEGFVHRFFDDEELASEIAEAGLFIAERRSGTFVLERGAFPEETPAAFASEVARAARLVTLAERRRFEPPAAAVRAMRSLGAGKEKRGLVGRARLRRAIGWIDAVHPKGASCYRRVLLELGLDRGAAEETVVFGLDVGRTGHVAFRDTEERTFDVAFEIAP